MNDRIKNFILYSSFMAQIISGIAIYQNVMSNPIYFFVLSTISFMAICYLLIVRYKNVSEKELFNNLRKMLPSDKKYRSVRYSVISALVLVTYSISAFTICIENYG